MIAFILLTPGNLADTYPFNFGQGAPAACDCFIFATNSSCGMGTGSLPSPGFQPNITNLSSVRCSTS
jgi:hypothetical protein